MGDAWAAVLAAATEPEWWELPHVTAGIGALLAAILVKLLDNYAASRKSREEFRKSDHEILSAEQKDFRLTIIKQLQQCHDDKILLDKERMRYQLENIQLVKDNARLQLDKEEQVRDIEHLQEELKTLREKAGTVVKDMAQAAAHMADAVSTVVNQQSKEEKK